jgi:hypothetical protein
MATFDLHGPLLFGSLRLKKEPGKSQSGGIATVAYKGAGFEWRLSDKRQGWLGKEVVENSLVIGNIYEHPGLLREP